MALPARREAAQAFADGLSLPKGGWAGPARTAALARLVESGLPFRRDEYWRYTDPAPLLAEAPHVADDTAASAFEALERVRLVFRGGVFDAEASDDPKAAGVELLSRAGGSDIHWARETYGTLEARGQTPVARPLAALNTALAPEGVLIRATKPNATPVELIYHVEPGASEVFLHHVVRLDPGASLTLLETGTAAGRGNTVLEVDIAEGATFHHLRTQGGDPARQVVSHVFARLGREARFRSFTLTAGGALSRNESVIELAGEDGSAHVAGVAMGGKGVSQDDTVFITHDAERCESRQVFKKVLRKGMTGVFQGKILVKQGAQKTDGYQISQALLLDDDASFLAKPELEIYADDVQCSHGSTSGAIDETALYYLRSRGVPKAEAEHLLVQAFLAEALAEIADPALAEAVLGRLTDGLAELR
ncbi:Fe-S cluster assembly protein SufD [Frigidibacter sp. ROC022]|uniref:Fe-S cluster assembly protein SufD n=1 Tax=Frigidibacter sp. ROC022 TaxID=2971796 RepID=UPI00215A8810|nr:Fe-S cluster assembly protein SufD [Frigidibacter sp. ROC022]MCR8723710.1 Fe-S cluster assembly protein SufD [Frigidibacter sp. ROC022]